MEENKEQKDAKDNKLVVEDKEGTNKTFDLRSKKNYNTNLQEIYNNIENMKPILNLKDIVIDIGLKFSKSMIQRN
jgi:hypothetical protein